LLRFSLQYLQIWRRRIFGFYC